MRVWVTMTGWAATSSSSTKPSPSHVALLREASADEDGNVSLAEEDAKLDIQACALAAQNSGGKVIVEVRERVRAGALPAHLSRSRAVGRRDRGRSGQMVTYDFAYDPAMSGVTRLPPHVRRRPSSTSGRRSRGGQRGTSGTGRWSISALAFPTRSRHSSPRTSARAAIPKRSSTASTAASSYRPCLRLLANASAMIDAPTQFDFYSGGGLDIAFLGFGQWTRRATSTPPSSAARRSALAALSTSRRTRKVVFCGTFDAKGAENRVGGGRLHNRREGRGRKLFGAVDQITFSGAKPTARPGGLVRHRAGRLPPYAGRRDAGRDRAGRRRRDGRAGQDGLPAGRGDAVGCDGAGDLCLGLRGRDSRRPDAP